MASEGEWNQSETKGAIKKKDGVPFRGEAVAPLEDDLGAEVSLIWGY